MSAKEMFEKLGYSVSSNLMQGSIINIDKTKKEMQSISVFHIEDREYDEEDEYIEDEDDFEYAKRIGKYRVKEIFFCNTIFEPAITIRYKKIKIQLKNNEPIVAFNGMGLIGELVSNGKFGTFMTPGELQAINKQVEELGWNNEKQ